jgi:hypothetical protein
MAVKWAGPTVILLHFHRLMKVLFISVMTPREVNPPITAYIVLYDPVNIHQTTIIDFTAAVWPFCN